MTDAQESRLGCLVILVVIWVCYMIFSDSNGPEKVDVDALMDEIVEKANAEAEVQISNLKQAYEVERQARESKFATESARLLNLMEIERCKTETVRKMVEERNSKEDELRTFALKESPSIWRTLQTLSAERDSLVSKINELSETLRRFGKDPSRDEDVVKLNEFKMQLESQISLVNGKLESAYLASKKYEAMPHRKDFNDLMLKSIEDGISAAEMAEKRYKELKRKENE